MLDRVRGNTGYTIKRAHQCIIKYEAKRALMSEPNIRIFPKNVELGSDGYNIWEQPGSDPGVTRSSHMRHTGATVMPGIMMQPMVADFTGLNI